MNIAIMKFINRCYFFFILQAKALEAEVINLRKEIEMMKNQHQLVDKQRLKAIQVKCTNL